MAPPDRMVEPTFQGFIDTTHDALVLFEACKQQQCDRVMRRLQDKERSLIGSGSVYVFDEDESRIKRWTDGRMWSPSRILGNFLVYRELDKRTPGDEPSVNGSELSRAEEEHLFGGSADGASSSRSGKQRERSLVGSLTSTFKFKRDGLVKKTLSVGALHLICYYCVSDVLEGRLRTPSSLPELLAFSISPSLLNPESFRIPPKVDHAPDGTPVFLAERDDNPPSKTPYNGNRAVLPTLNTALPLANSPADSVVYHSASDYFSFAFDTSGSTPSSMSSGGEARTSSGGSGCQPEQSSCNGDMSSIGTSQGQYVPSGPVRPSSQRNRHSPYSTSRPMLPPEQYSNMRPEGGFNHSQETAQNASASSFPGSASNHFFLRNHYLDNPERTSQPNSPALASFSHGLPSPSESVSSMPNYDMSQHRQSIPNVLRPFSSYADNTSIHSSNANVGRQSDRNRANSVGYPIGQPRMASGNHLAWNTHTGAYNLLSHDQEVSSANEVAFSHLSHQHQSPPEPSYLSANRLPQSNHHKVLSPRPETSSNLSSLPNGYHGTSSSLGLQDEPRSALQHSTSPFYYNPPPHPLPLEIPSFEEQREDTRRSFSYGQPSVLAPGNSLGYSVAQPSRYLQYYANNVRGPSIQNEAAPVWGQNDNR